MNEYNIKWVWLESGKGPDCGIITYQKIDYWFMVNKSPSPVKCSYPEFFTDQIILCKITDTDKNRLFEEHKKYCLLTKKPLMRGDPFSYNGIQKELKHKFNINNNTIQGEYYKTIDKKEISNWYIPNRMTTQ